MTSDKIDRWSKANKLNTDNIKQNGNFIRSLCLATNSMMIDNYNRELRKKMHTQEAKNKLKI